MKRLPLPHSLCILLQEFKRFYGDACPYVFHPVRNNSHATTDKPISSVYLFKLVQRSSKQVNIDKKISPHSLRKTFIELALDEGEDLISIANGTGHGSVEMIKYYDTRDRLKKNAIHRFGHLI